MLCDECGKNKATVHLTEIINEQITKLNLCETCAKQKGSDAEQHFGIADLLAALSDVETQPHPAGSGAAPAVTPVSSKARCGNCGLTYDDFKKVGRLGCSECYAVFKSSLAPLLKRIHGAAQHVGKSPTAESQREVRTTLKLHEELQAVRIQLQKAVKNEEFEEAAALRDKIKFLEKKIKESNKESKVAET